MSIRNAIFVGFAWAQAFRISSAVLAPTSSLRVDWRKDAATPIAVRSSVAGGGVTVVDDVYTIGMSRDVTSLLTPGYLSGDMVEVRDDGTERVMGVRVRVPVVLSLAEPTP